MLKWMSPSYDNKMALWGHEEKGALRAPALMRSRPRQQRHHSTDVECSHGSPYVGAFCCSPR